jgi:ABC-type phosphate transport system auxiliary subunit
MQPSARLVRAVAAERADLERHRARLAGEADELRAALARIEQGMAEIDARRGLLDQIAPPEEEQSLTQEEPARGELRGPAIREAAVRALLERGLEELHYRDWYELLTAAGQTIAGKDPLAVFLTQLSRSPALRKGPRAGVYALDRHAAARLRGTLAALHEELRELSVGDSARRAELTAEIGRAERALEELTRVLKPALAKAG